MTELTYSSDLVVERIQHIGSDDMIAKAARVSTGADQIEGLKKEGLIKYLANAKHTSPFEHTSITYRIEAEVAVSREAMRHRVFSFNEISARYADLPYLFYVPPRHRPLVNAGTGARPDLQPGTDEQYAAMVASRVRLYQTAVDEYDYQRDLGIASEVAREVLPFGIYTAWYMTGNLHAWLHFLGLRNAPNALWEIREVAKQIEADLTELFPLTMKHWPRGDVA